jgi:hypothetical protein
MDTELLVDDQIDDGQWLIEQLVKDEFEVSAAFWLKRSEDALWRLFIASPLADTENRGRAYDKIYKALDGISNSSVTPLDINLIDDKNPIAQSAIELRDRRSAKTPTKYHGRRLGTLSIQEAYIYPRSEVPLRQSFLMTYVRQGETNHWVATTQAKEFHRNLKSQGAVSYSTAFWQGDKPQDPKFARIYVLVEVDPSLDERTIMTNPGLGIALAQQARSLADEMFRTKNPDAIITHGEIVLRPD